MTESSHSVESLFGVRREVLLKKLKVEKAGSPEWRKQALQLLNRREDCYTLEECRVLAEVLCSDVDRRILGEPARYNYLQVRTARQNQKLCRRAKRTLAELSNPKQAEKSDTMDTDGPRPSPIAKEYGPVILDQVKTGRFRVFCPHKNHLIGHIWRTRMAVGSGNIEAGWTHTRAERLFSGPGSKKAVVGDLLEMYEEGRNERDSPPQWIGK